jgi:hypothetical protein
VFGASNTDSLSSIRGFLISLLVAAALSATYYYNSASFSFAHANTESTFKSFSAGLDSYRKEMPGAWKPRLFSNFLAGAMMPLDARDDGFALRIGAWNGCWFLFCCLAYILGDRRNALFLMFGTFAALYYAFTPAAGIRIYPWDIPPMFFFVILCLAVRARNAAVAMCALFVGTGFKETVALGSLVFLFWKDLSRNARLAYTLVSIAGCAAVKIGIDIFTHNPSLGFSMEFIVYGPLVGRSVQETGIALVYNIHTFLTPILNHPLFINGGTFFAFLVLPMRDADDLMWKTVGLLFLAGMMVFSVINEYRVFFEMIPVSLWAISKMWYRECATDQVIPTYGRT